MTANDPKRTFLKHEVMNKLYIVLLLVILSACSTSNIHDDGSIGFSPGCHKSDYSPAKDSIYVLPYPIGREYGISQGNCGIYTHKRDFLNGVHGDLRYAYDFEIPIGQDITAARSGEVLTIEERYEDYTNDIWQTNYIQILHDDGTIGVYLHFTKNGVLVDVGDEIKQGVKIGIAGATGYVGYIPHLHFHVFEKEHKSCTLYGTDDSEYNFKGCKTLPITFKNAEPLDIPPLNSKRYKALEY